MNPSPKRYLSKETIWIKNTTYIMIPLNTTGTTSGAGTAYPSGAHEFTPGF